MKFNKEQKLILFGAGENCGIVLDLLKEAGMDIYVEYIVDNMPDLKESKIEEFPIYKADRENCCRADKIIVTSDFYYNQIKEQLISYKLEEGVNFFNAKDELPRYIFSCAGKVVNLNTAFYLTTKCTLKCKFCTQRSPYLKNKKNFEIDAVMEDLTAYFNVVDYTYEIMLVGGEPLLYDKLDNVIKDIFLNFSNQFEKLTIITNGTIALSDEIITVIKDKNVFFEISDYGETVNRKKIFRLVDQLEEHKIKYNIIHHKNWTNMWSDKKIEIYSENRKKFLNCNNKCRSVYQKKYFLCAQPVAEMFMNEGIQFEQEDYFNLKEPEKDNNSLKKEFTEYNAFNMRKGYISTCMKCNGANNELYKIPVGEQL